MNNSKYIIKLKYFFWILYAYLISCIIFPSNENYGSTSDYGLNRLIPQILSFLLIIISSTCLKKILFTKKMVLKSFYLFAIYTFLSYLFFLFGGNSFSLYFLADTLKIFIWIFPIYYLYNIFLNIDDYVIEKYLKKYCVIFIAYLIISIFQEYSFRSTGTIEIMTEEQGVYAGGAIYFLVPLIFISFSRRLSTYLFFLAFAIAILTAKRTPIILLSVFAVFQLRSMLFSLKKKDYIILSIIICLTVSLLLTSYWDMMMNRNISDMERGGTYGSGREIFYAIVIQGWLDGNILEKIFGHGYGSVHLLLLEKYGMAISSHNGFLDAIYVYGLLGLLLYLLIFVFLIRKLEYIKKYTKYYKVYVGFIVMWFVQNLIIHGFTGPNMVPYGIFIAYIFARAYKNKYFIETRINNESRC